jgi:hypothetical protein
MSAQISVLEKKASAVKPAACVGACVNKAVKHALTSFSMSKTKMKQLVECLQKG